MKYKEFIKNNIDIIKKYDIKIFSINKIDHHEKKFYKNNLKKYYKTNELYKVINKLK